MKNQKFNITLLVLLHLFIFNVFYTYRFTPSESLATLKVWHDKHRLPSWNTYLKLFLSNITDETYYYEWSTIVLGKTFEENYPFDLRKESLVSKYFYEKPAFHLPYRDISFEYPPLLAVPMLLSRSLTSSSVNFVRILAFILSLFYMALLWICEKIRRKLEIPLTTTHFLLLSLFSLPALGSLFVTRLDIIPTFFYVLAIWGLIEGSTTKGLLGIFLGFFSKGFSIILIPLFAFEWIRQKKYTSLFVSSFILLSITFLMMGVLQKISGGYYLDSFKYHAERGIQVESLYSLFPWALFLGHLKIICLYIDHGSISISLQNNEALIWTSKILPLLIFSGIYIRVFFIRKLLNPAKLFQISFFLLFTFLISFKVFSPQFLIWLIPLIFLTPVEQNKLILVLWFSLLLVTQVLYPHCYVFLIENTQEWAILLLSLRNLTLLLIWFFLLSSLWKDTKKISFY